MGATYRATPALLNYAERALESIVYQTKDLYDAMREEYQSFSKDSSDNVLRVDGGISSSDWTMQFFLTCSMPLLIDPQL